MMRFTILRFLGAVVGGVLLGTAFPPLAEGQAAWLALVPLLLALQGVKARRGFELGYAFGLAFWAVCLFWLVRLGFTGCPLALAIVGWLGLAACLALFQGLFGLLAAVAFRTVRVRVALLFVFPVLWIGLEYVRAVIATGFPWNGLGVSQYSNLPILQLAAWGGVYLVSGVVVVMNTGLALMLLRVGETWRGGQRRRVQLELAVSLLIVALCWGMGIRRVRAEGSAMRRDGRTLRIAAIQPNVAQPKKWSETYVRDIYLAIEDCMALVTPIAAQLDLVVWPETAVPGFLPLDGESDSFIRGLAREAKTPVLVGAMEAVPKEDQGWYLYNSSFLYDGAGQVKGVYRKQHLVPFGEYLPLDETISWPEALAPLGFSCTAGRESTVLWIGDVPFSVLICFEDVFPDVARRAVRAGARLLINQTNDAWFDGSSAAVQHMSHSVLRCVENGVPMVRSANTGVTCFIDRTGQVDETTRDMVARGEWALVDTRSGIVRIPGSDWKPTFYTRYGDGVLAIPCATATVAWLVFLLWGARRARCGEPIVDVDPGTEKEC